MELLLIPLVGLIGLAVYRLVSVRPVPKDLVARFEAMERDMKAVQQQLAETQERLDFTERMLSKARQ